MKDIIKNFKEKLHSDGVVGVFSKTCDPAFIETIGYAGMDYVIIDLEHGPNSVQSVQNLIRGAQVAGLMPIVRVKESCSSVMGEVLDIGAGGIQVPQIGTREEAEAVIKRTKFSPVGERGVCRFVRAANYSSKDRFEYFKDANKAVTILQIEGQAGIDNLDDIISVRGIDAIFIGPYDLSQSLGVAGQIDHPLVEAKMLEIVKKCAEVGVTVGTFVDTIENARKWKKLGVKYISYSVDVGIFYDATRSIIKEIK
ncbi:MAG: aldolase [Clostridia bacterium]|nr:aldolase [Clostridia bacterium]